MKDEKLLLWPQKMPLDHRKTVSQAHVNLPVVNTVISTTTSQNTTATIVFRGSTTFPTLAKYQLIQIYKNKLRKLTNQQHHQIL